MATKETKTADQTSEVIEPVVAEPKTESEPTGWTVSVNNNAAYCGIGAGGANAKMLSKRSIETPISKMTMILFLFLLITISFCLVAT